MPESVGRAASRTIGRLLASSLAPGTWAAYDRDWRLWQDWYSLFWAVQRDFETLLLLYGGHCRDAGWSVSRVSKCMAALAFGFKLRGQLDMTKGFLVSQALKGWRRFRVAEDPRKPVSFQMLQDLGCCLGGFCTSALETVLFRLAFSLKFFGALRLGELVSPGKVKVGGLLKGDVDLFPDRLVFSLRWSKTDQEGRGRRVTLIEVPGSTMCPVRCLRNFREMRGRTCFDASLVVPC